MAIAAKGYESDADDEYERSIMTSPILATDDDDSPTDTDPPSTEPTPTAFGHHIELGKASPANTIAVWTAGQCADYLSSLGLSQYCDLFLENEIVGEALVALRHEELKEMGIVSVGHRLTVLKGVYDVKQNHRVPIESDHWVPPSAEASEKDQQVTRQDMDRIIRSLELRDHRIQAAEAEIRKITDEYRRLRDELLPIFRAAKDRSQPLPYPSPEHPEDNGLSPGPGPPPADSKPSALSRKFSTKRLFLGGNPTPKSSSPTYPQTYSSSTIADTSTLDPSAAAIAASNHLTAGMNGGINPRSDGSQPSPSPNQASMPSPTSPNTYTTALRNAPYQNQANAQSTARSIYSHAEESSYPNTNTFISERDRSNPTPTPRVDRRPYAATTSSLTPQDDNPPPSAGASNNAASSSGGGGPSVEIFKSFRVSMDDPCEKVLPAALKKYNINADWKNYALYIVYGDQERCLGLKEKPLILFKQLDREGKKPMFMLRKHAAPMEGHSGPTGFAGADGGGLGGAGGGPYGSGLGGRGMTSSIQLPGGVL